MLLNLSIPFVSLHVLLQSKKAVIENFTGFTQGTTYSIVYDNSINITPQDLKVKVEKILHDFDISLSVYKDSQLFQELTGTRRCTGFILH